MSYQLQPAPIPTKVYPRPFDLDNYLTATIADPRLLTFPDGRRELTRTDPLLFALTYLPDHLRDDSTGGQVTLSDFHLDLATEAVNWIRPLRRPRAFRDAYVAPRGTGKSTWLFLILPLWAAAHGHVRFIAAFADSTSQAEQHLMNFKHELETNELLNVDYPDLTAPLVGTKVARQLANSRGQIQQANGFTFMARGIDSAVAGMKVGHTRPQVIVLDDVEPDESNYSAHTMAKRRTTLLDNILPLNIFARVVLSGTVTMPGSIVHQLVKTQTTTEPTEPWISDENFSTHYYPALIKADEGDYRSLWPQKWPLPELLSQRHTRSFAKNMMNMPMSGAGTFWNPSDYRYVTQPTYGHTLLWVDPAVTSKATSDYTGLAIVSLTSGGKMPMTVRYARGVKLPPAALKARILELCEQFPEMGLIKVESNQGGDTWNELLSGLPVKVSTQHSSIAKPVRIERSLVAYQRGLVLHSERHDELEAQQQSYPDVANDDVVDAAAGAILYFLDHLGRGSGRSMSQQSYVNR